jgi:hypothetical protein
MTEPSKELIIALVEWTVALRHHEAVKSDPSQNVASGQALYAAEFRLRALALGVKE